MVTLSGAQRLGVQEPEGNPSMRWYLLASTALLAFTACALPPSEQEVERSGDRNEFAGTPDEYTELWRGCVEDKGLVTRDEDGIGNFSAGHPDLSHKEVDQIVRDCSEALGRQPMTDLSDEELRRRYEARVEQHGCLIDEGLVSGGDSPSFEVFVDQYQRSGQTSLWEPASEAVHQIDGRPVSPSDLCPRPGQIW